MAPEMPVSLKLAGAIRASVVQKAAYIGAHVEDGLPTETTLIFVVSHECCWSQRLTPILKLSELSQP